MKKRKLVEEQKTKLSASEKEKEILEDELSQCRQQLEKAEADKDQLNKDILKKEQEKSDLQKEKSELEKEVQLFAFRSRPTNRKIVYPSWQASL